MFAKAAYSATAIAIAAALLSGCAHVTGDHRMAGDRAQKMGCPMMNQDSTGTPNSHEMAQGMAMNCPMMGSKPTSAEGHDEHHPK